MNDSLEQPDPRIIVPAVATDGTEAPEWNWQISEETIRRIEDIERRMHGWRFW